jgi:hypothetical protein
LSFSDTSNYAIFEYLYDTRVIDSIKVFMILHLFVSVFILFYFCLRREMLAIRFRLIKRNNLINLTKQLLNIAIKSGITSDIIHYFLLSGIVSKSISIFQCIQIDSNFKYYVIREDVTVSCRSNDYNQGILWCTIGLFCYILSIIIMFIINLRLKSLSISFIFEQYQDLEFTIFIKSLNKLIWIAISGYGHVDIYWDLLEKLRRVIYFAIMPLLQLYTSLFVQVYIFIGFITLNILLSCLIIQDNKQHNNNHLNNDNDSITTTASSTTSTTNNNLNKINDYTQVNLNYSLKSNYQIILLLLGVIIIHSAEVFDYNFLNYLYFNLIFDICLSLIVLWIPTTLLYYTVKEMLYNRKSLNNLEINYSNFKHNV